MLLEKDIKFLNELRRKNKTAYERKLRILGISDEDVPRMDVVTPSRDSSSETYFNTHYSYSSYRNTYYDNCIFDDVYYMGGKPYAGPGWKKTKATDQSMTKTKIKKIAKSDSVKSRTKSNSNVKKKHPTVDLYIDAENVGAQHADEIIKKAEREGKVSQKKYYGRQKDGSIEPWKEKGKAHDIKPILVSKEPEKDKVDKKIKKDIRKSIRNGSCADEIVISTSDGGYKDIIEEARAAGKKVTILGEKKAPQKLRNAADKFEKI